MTYLLATRGEAGIAGMPPDEVGPLRVEEERRSAAVVGVSEVEFLDHRDGVVEYGLRLRRDLAAAFRRLQPGVVITMSFDLTWGEEGPVNHADHRAVGLAVLDACRDAANGWVFPGPGRPGPASGTPTWPRPGTRTTSPTSPRPSTRASRRCASTAPTSRAWAGSSTPTSSCRTWPGYIGLGRRVRVRGRLPPLPDGLAGGALLPGPDSRPRLPGPAGGALVPGPERRRLRAGGCHGV